MRWHRWQPADPHGEALHQAPLLFHPEPHTDPVPVLPAPPEGHLPASWHLAPEYNKDLHSNKDALSAHPLLYNNIHWESMVLSEES